MLLQTPLPKEYYQLDDEQLDRRIVRAKEALDGGLLILGHHYQRDEVIRYADFRGDSLKLAQQAAQRADAEFIVFCGVHFMAESADILTADHQKVILPDLSAGCSMADMADIEQVETCWDDLEDVVEGEGILPITYINSAASLKAFVGRQDGTVCTSTNAPVALAWALERADKVLFFPDQHLGRNTGVKLGISLDDMIVWDPYQPLGGNREEDIRRARLILWKGHCSVHQRFTVQQVEQARAQHPGIRVIVHPECAYEVVQAADDNGSTEYILKQVTNSPPGSQFAVGTELHLVRRLGKENPDKLVVSLDDCVCFCATMYRISPQHLCWSLESLAQRNVVNQIRVPEETAHWARISLDRMLELQ